MEEYGLRMHRSLGEGIRCTETGVRGKSSVRGLSQWPPKCMSGGISITQSSNSSAPSQTHQIRNSEERVPDFVLYRGTQMAWVAGKDRELWVCKTAQ